MSFPFSIMWIDGGFTTKAKGKPFCHFRPLVICDTSLPVLQPPCDNHEGARPIGKPSWMDAPTMPMFRFSFPRID